MNSPEFQVEKKSRAPRLAAAATAFVLTACSPFTGGDRDVRAAGNRSASISETATETSELQDALQTAAEYYAESAVEEFSNGNTEIEDIIYDNDENPTEAQVTIQKSEPYDGFDHLRTTLSVIMDTDGHDPVPSTVSEVEFEQTAFASAAEIPSSDLPGNSQDIASFVLTKSGDTWSLDSSDETQEALTPELFAIANDKVREEYEEALAAEVDY